MARLKGGTYVDGDLNVAANVTSGGTITGVTKNFEIADPRENGGRLVHSCLEGPENGVYYRGDGVLKDGRCVVSLPDYFEALTRKEGRTVQVTPIAGPGDVFPHLAASRVADGKFSVYAPFWGEPVEFYWEVKAVRKDVPLLIAEKRGDEIR